MALALPRVFEIIKLNAEHFPELTDTDLRGIVTHWLPRSLKSYTRFSGMVSAGALAELIAMGSTYVGHRVIKEHPERIQTKATAFLGEMRRTGDWDYFRFETFIKAHSRINITTPAENDALRTGDNTYESLGIELIHWDDLPQGVRKIIKQKLLTSSVANRHDFGVIV